MSQGGTKRKRERSDLISRLEALRLSPGDVILLRLPDAQIDDPMRLQEAQAFIQQIADMTKRGVAIVRQSTDLQAWRPPPPEPPSRIERVKPIAMTTQPSERTQIIVPGFRK